MRGFLFLRLFLGILGFAPLQGAARAAASYKLPGAVVAASTAYEKMREDTNLRLLRFRVTTMRTIPVSPLATGLREEAKTSDAAKGGAVAPHALFHLPPIALLDAEKGAITPPTPDGAAASAKPVTVLPVVSPREGTDDPSVLSVGGAGASAAAVPKDPSDEKWTSHKTACVMVKQIIAGAFLYEADVDDQQVLYNFFSGVLKVYERKYSDDCWHVLKHFQESLSALLTWNDGTSRYFCPSHYERLRHLRKVFDNRFFNEKDVRVRRKLVAEASSVEKETAEKRAAFSTRDFLIGRWHDDLIDDLFINDLNVAIPQLKASEPRWVASLFNKKVGDCWLYYLSLIAPSAIFDEERLSEPEHQAFKLGGAFALLVWYRFHVDAEAPLSLALPSP